MDTLLRLEKTANEYGYKLLLRSSNLNKWDLCNEDGKVLKILVLNKKTIHIRSVVSNGLDFSMPISKPENLSVFLESYYFAKKV